MGNEQEIKEMKYEGLAALIIEGQRAAEVRHTDLRKDVNRRFDKVDERLHDNEEYNRIQNGRQADAMEKIHDLEVESGKRKLTCMAAVEILQKRTKYTKLFKWVDEHPKRAIAITLVVVVGVQSIILHAFANNWLSELWKFIKDVI